MPVRERRKGLWSLQFVVYNETAGFLGEFGTRMEADACMVREREACARECGTDGQESRPGNGDFACGVLSEHGIHLQIIEDGQDGTKNDYGQYN